MELERIDSFEPQSWDREVSQLETGLIFHHSAWLDYLQQAFKWKLLTFRAIEGGTTVGLFTGLLQKKGPFTILGSPLPGTLTDYLGPALDQKAGVEEFLAALERMCRRQGIDLVQLGHPALQPDLMAREGFTAYNGELLEIPLSAEPEEMWANLKGKCRNRIRKAQKSGLEVVDGDEPELIDDYYRQHTEVFARQNLPPKYPLQVVRALHGSLKPRDMLFCLRVRQGPRTIATGLFPHDHKFAFSFGIASYEADRHLCPNELLYWTAMCLAGQRGIRSLAIGGHYKSDPATTRFKEKFNARSVPFQRFTKAYSASGKILYRLFKKIELLRK